MNNEIVVRVNPVELVQLQHDSGELVFNPAAEDALIKLLEIQKAVDGAVEAAKAEIERTALKFNENFSSIRGNKIKVNYSAAGAKYKDAGTAKNHRGKFWTKKTTWGLNTKAIDEYRAKNYSLPTGIVEVARRKTIRFSEVGDAK